MPPVHTGHVQHRRRATARALLSVLALLLFSLAARSAPTILLPAHRLRADELAVIVNDRDPLSRRIADYYRQARGVPDANIIHVRFPPGNIALSPHAFARIYHDVQSALSPRIQALALTWAEPWKVGCMSITSAFTFGFDRGWCSKKLCASTRHSPYYRSRSPAPYRDFGIRPTMAIAATGFDQARALIDRGVASDGTRPPGTAWLVSTRDRARNVRAFGYPAVANAMRGWIDTRVVETGALRGARDILFYFTGRARVEALDTLGFRPGAVADHLTSAGGQLTTSKQMSALRWLEAGATGSYGAVVEPCNLTAKFPNPGLLMEAYGSGRTLIEAYWQSVQQPGEGIFVGEPLAAPFDTVKVRDEDDHILLVTRTLSPGHYNISVSGSPVGPFRPLPGDLEVKYHQTEFQLPKIPAPYYRVTPTAN